VEENIFFHKGIDSSETSSLQQPGFLKTAVNVLFEIEGKQKLRPSFVAVNATPLGSIHSVGVLRGSLVVGHGVTLTWIDSAGAQQTLASVFTNYPWVWKEYKDFLHGVNGTGDVLFDADGRLYPGKVENPITAVTLADAASGSGPSGHYMGYVSYYITWPNGMTYETGLSPASTDLNITDNTINWSAIPICPYVAYCGMEPTIHRKLYRGPGTGGSLAGIYFVATIANNTATTYADSFTDADLAAAGLCLVEDYGPMPDCYLHEYHYGRRFCIDMDYVFRQCYSEAATGETAAENESILPIATKENNYDDIRVPGFKGGVEPQALTAWGVYLHTGLKQTWMRKQGNDPATWSYKKTYANHGVIAAQSVDICSNPASVWGFTLSPDGDMGIALYNGQSAEIVQTIKLKDLLKTGLNATYASSCRAKMVGGYYHFLYPSILSADGTPDTHLAMDISRYPDVRVGNWSGLFSTALAVDERSGDFYIGGSDGYVRKRAATGESISFEISTHELIGGKPELSNHKKTLKELRYSLNTGGVDVTLEFWIDEVLKPWPDGTTTRTISGTDDSIQVLNNLPMDWTGYKTRLKVYGTAMTTVEINSPWTLVFDVTV
jgi:hypothetical protein